MTKIYNGRGEYSCHLSSGRTIELTEEELAELAGEDFIHSGNLIDLEDNINNLEQEVSDFLKKSTDENPCIHEAELMMEILEQMKTCLAKK